MVFGELAGEGLGDPGDPGKSWEIPLNGDDTCAIESKLRIKIIHVLQNKL